MSVYYDFNLICRFNRENHLNQSIINLYFKQTIFVLSALTIYRVSQISTDKINLIEDKIRQKERRSLVKG